MQTVILSRKAAIFAIYNGEAGYFGTGPTPDLARSSELARRLPFRIAGEVGVAGLELWPHARRIGVGVYERGALVVHSSLLDDCLSADSHGVTEAMLEFFPDGTFLALGLHSVVNFFGYTQIEQGRVTRRFGGAEDHLDADLGVPLAEEIPHFERSTVRDGMRYFVTPALPDEEIDAPAYGEELVMALSPRLFGKPLRDLDGPIVTIPYFAQKPWWRRW